MSARTVNPRGTLRALGHAGVVEPRRTFALQIGEEASKLPHHQSLPEALLRAVGEAQLGETVIVLQVEDDADSGRLAITALAKIGPVVS